MHVFEGLNNNLYQIDINGYIELIQGCLLTPHRVEKGLVMPSYFKFFFNLLDLGNKGYVCEHDLFILTQNLNTEKDMEIKMTASEKKAQLQKEIDRMLSYDIKDKFKTPQ